MTIADYQALAEFRYQIRRFLHFSEQQARAHNLEPQQHQLLLAIKGLPAGHKPTIGELAERLQLRHHSTVELVNRLESRGAIARSTGDDRREVMLTVTANGEALLQSLSVAHQQELETAGPKLAESLRFAMQKGNRAA
jgi:DNA-binding MarR family transcriptional regulator